MPIGTLDKHDFNLGYGKTECKGNEYDMWI